MATIQSGMAWFKTHFGDAVTQAVANTPFSLDLLTAIAVQETFEVWGQLLKTTTDPATILPLCVGDTLDAPNRSAFPTSKAQLLQAPHGGEMFAVARAALEAIGEYNAGYHKVAAANPDKFCHGYGIFQYDIQFYHSDAAFFLDRQWHSFDACLERALRELDAAMKRAYGGPRHLDHAAMVYVAIAYNHGSVNTHGSFQQGFLDDSGRFYGEMIDQYLTLAATVQPQASAPLAAE